MIRIGLVGCGHIGTVHAVALQQLADADLIDAELTATFDDDADRAAKVARHHGGEPVATLDARCSTPSTWCGSARGRPAHLAAVEAAADRGVAIFCEKPLAPDLADCDACRPTRSNACPHQVGLVLRWAPVFAESRRAIASGDYGRVLATVMRDDQYFPIQGLYGSTWRGDVAASGWRHADRAFDPRHRRAALDARRPGRGLGPHRDPFRLRRHRRHGRGPPRVRRRLGCRSSTSVWHQVLTRESSRRLEVFCEKALLWTEDDYLGPLLVQTDDGVATIEASAPEWAGELHLPEVYAKALAQYARRLRSPSSMRWSRGDDAGGLSPPRVRRSRRTGSSTSSTDPRPTAGAQTAA